MQGLGGDIFLLLFRALIEYAEFAVIAIFNQNLQGCKKESKWKQQHLYYEYNHAFRLADDKETAKYYCTFMVN